MTADTQAQGDLVKLAEKCGAQQCGEYGEFLGFPSVEALQAFAAALQGRGTPAGFLAYQADDEKPKFFPSMAVLEAGTARWHPPVSRIEPLYRGTQEGEPSDAAFLQEADQHLLHRFIETTEDGEGYDIGKEAVKRLAELGVVQSVGFGRYGVTMFGYWAHERFWHQNPSLPLLTNSDRDTRAALAQAQKERT